MKKSVTKKQNSSDKRITKARTKLPALRNTAKELDTEVAALNLECDGGPEAVFKRQYVRMLKYNSKLIKRLNDQLEGKLSSRDIYALSTLQSQQREVISDLRTIVDMSEQVEMVQRKVLAPFVGDTAQLVTDIYFQLRKLLSEVTIPKQTQFALDHLDELLKQLGTGLQQSHVSAKDKLYQILLGSDEPKKRKSIKR